MLLFPDLHACQWKIRVMRNGSLVAIQVMDEIIYLWYVNPGFRWMLFPKAIWKKKENLVLNELGCHGENEGESSKIHTRLPMFLHSLKRNHLVLIPENICIVTVINVPGPFLIFQNPSRYRTNEPYLHSLSVTVNNSTKKEFRRIRYIDCLKT